MQRRSPIRLTIPRLAAVALGCVAFVAGLNFVLQNLTLESSPEEIRATARELYAVDSFQRAEKLLAERLADAPDERSTLELLIRARITRGGEQAAYSVPDEYLSGTELAGLIAQSADSIQHRLFLELAWPLAQQLRADGDDPGEAYRRKVLRAAFQPHPTADADLFAHLARFLFERNANADAGSVALYGLEESGANTAGTAGDALRQALLDSLLQLERYTAFVERMDTAAFQNAADAYQRYTYHLKQGRYLAMLPPLIETQLGKYRTKFVLAALAVGLCWLVLLAMLAQADSWSRMHWLLGALALPLGALSAYLTIVVLLITEEFIPFGKLEATTINLLLENVLGVGLREELLKLLCFLPLVPALLYTRAPATVVIAVGALIGLGFAVEENIAYYIEAGGGAVVARYLTANFFHMTLSGFAGYYLVRAIQSRTVEGWTDFAAGLLLIIGVHGLYDFLLGGVFERSGEVALILHLALTYQFLSLFAEQADHGPRRWLPLGYVFTASLVLLAGIGFLLLNQILPAGDAIRTVLYDSLPLATIAAVFFIGFRESLD